MQTRQSMQTGGDLVDLREYLTVLRRRAPVIVIMTLLGLGLAVGYSKLQTPIYTATSKVLVNPPPGDSTGQNLSNLISMDTEAQVVGSAPIAGTAARALGSPLTIPQLLRHVSVQTSVDNFVLEISYWDPRPGQAALGANTFAKAYLDYKREQAQAQIEEQRGSIAAEIDRLEREQRQQNRILETSSRGTIEYRNARDALSQLNISLGVQTSSLAQLPQIVNPGQVILPASAPRSPSKPNIPMNTAVGLLLGLFGGILTAFVLDRMDDRIHTAADLQRYLDAPVLAFVPHVKGRGRHRAAQLVVHREPRSSVAEAYRTVRTSVMSMAHKRGLKVFAVASAVQSEGKSMSCANVAAALGQTDKRVLVLSADIRKPRIHEFFGTSNERGLSEVLEGEASFGEVVERSEVNNVWVLPGGRFPARPAELLQSPAMADLLAAVREEFDFVIIDCPPVLGLADCLAVLPLADAVLLVVQAGNTRGGAILEVGERLERVGVSIDAVIINDVHVPRGRPGHHSYGYYIAADEYLRPQESERHRARSTPSRARETSGFEGNGMEGSRRESGQPRQSRPTSDSVQNRNGEPAVPGRAKPSHSSPDPR